MTTPHSASVRAARSAALHALAGDLPGSQPYENRRPIRVPARFTGQRVDRFLIERFAHVPAVRWLDALAAGEILWEGRHPARPEQCVKGGTELIHVLPQTIEPWVDARIDVLYEDDEIVVVAKPAPLPMHPCGRFARNTLTSLLRIGLNGIETHIVHRLDADTTGAVVLAKNRRSARFLVDAFRERRIRKLYLAQVYRGNLLPTTSRCDAAISKTSAVAGTREVDANGRASTTHVYRRGLSADDLALVEAAPEGGRTHQIRLHLAAMGHPIVGDRAYAALPCVAISGLAGGGLRLHAWILDLPHPNGTRLQVRAPWPSWVDQAQSMAAPEPVAPGW